MRRYLSAIASTFVLLSGLRALAQEELFLHSDLPLELGHDQIEWPTHCAVLAYCTKFSTGDWRTHWISGYDTWVELEVNSPIHGMYVYFQSDQRTSDPRDRTTEIAAIVQLTPAEDKIGLYALEIGFLGGSRIILLSAGNDNSPIKRATVLNPRCLTNLPGVEYRAAKTRRIVLTDYCAVNSIGSLQKIATDALNRPPAATLEWVGPHSDEPQKQSP